MNQKNCKNCGNKILDPTFGEYKCYVNERRCTDGEVEYGCPDWSEKKAIKIETKFIEVRKDGATFIPHIKDGWLSWTNDQNLPNPEPVQIVFNGSGSTGSGNGQGGKDGVSVTHSWDGTTLILTSASGTTSTDLKGDPGKDGHTPVKGVDYFTEDDEADLASAVLAKLPVYNGEAVIL